MTQNQNPIALFIPCFNEKNRINIDAFQSFIHLNKEEIDFYFIDDGSTDSTSKLIEQHLVGNINVFLIVLEKNLGKGNALRKGILDNKNKDYSFFGFIDADLDIPLEQVKKLYFAIKNSDHLLAISQRALKEKFTFTKLRSISSLTMVFIANRLIGFDPKLLDTQCGCKLFKRDILNISFEDAFISEWLFDIEIFLRIKRNVERSREIICEVPLTRINHSGNSNFLFRKNLKIIKQLYLINANYNK